jgi:hypothetical protein
MDKLHPRSTYRRANSDEPDSNQDYTVELSSINSNFSSSSPNKRLLSTSDLKDHTQSVPPRQDSVFGLGILTRRPFNGFHGWRVGALSAAGLALLSLLINVAVVSWLGSRNQGAGLVEIFKGDCARVQELDIWTHLAINALSTLLLGGSNYCMQCLCAPTRKDIDRSHKQGRWLDIGVPSVRNLRNVATSKACLWWLLGLSSLPLHLM